MHDMTAVEAVDADAAFAALRRRTAVRYRSCRRTARHFVAWKLRLDPVHEAVVAAARHGTLGQVVDLGCGCGQLAVALAEGGLAEHVLALDCDERRLADGARAARGLPVAFAPADARLTALPACDTLLLIDVLIELSVTEQLALIVRAAAVVRRRMFIRTFDPACGWRSQVGHVAEALSHAFHLRRVLTRQPVPVEVLVETLATNGFASSIAPCWGGTPFPNVLVIADRVPSRGH
jgi:hypothetical protein